MENYDALLEFERQLYGLIYFGSIALVALWETVAPQRSAAKMLRLRWANNFAFSIINTLLERGVFPLAGLVFAILVAEQNWGLFQNVAIPYWLAFVVSFLVIDFTVWFQHYLLHRFPLLWRIHRLHHTDTDYDFTLSFRFHPIEAVYTTTFQLAAIALVGAPIEVVMAHMLIFTFVSFFAHGNIRLPGNADGVLRTCIVTPQMHRIHHSKDEREMNTNLGGVLSWWDRLLGTYTQAPAKGYDNMVVGLDAFRERRHHTLGWMLLNPFLSSPRPLGEDSPATS